MMCGGNAVFLETDGCCPPWCLSQRKMTRAIMTIGEEFLYWEGGGPSSPRKATEAG